MVCLLGMSPNPQFSQIPSLDKIPLPWKKKNKKKTDISHFNFFSLLKQHPLYNTVKKVSKKSIKIKTINNNNNITDRDFTKLKSITIIILGNSGVNHSR